MLAIYRESVVQRITYGPQLPSRAVDKYLMPSERVVTTVRMHPVAIISSVLLDPGRRNPRWPPDQRPPTATAGLSWPSGCCGACCSCGRAGKIATWWRRYFVVTENRLMLVTSLVFTDVAMMPLAKVTDLRLSESILGRMLRYGEFIVESAGQEQALSRVRFVPYPSQIYQEILSLIFPSKPAAAGPQGPLERAGGASGPSWPDTPLRGHRRRVLRSVPGTTPGSEPRRLRGGTLISRSVWNQ